MDAQEKNEPRKWHPMWVHFANDLPASDKPKFGVLTARTDF
ncbi:hypothetical protein NBRC3257_2767 [Gluconobacter thailandicus NBRC 3257]|uniref:Uncharacterized protein n=1 Tax=Gluconobacter thailandicus NBRC 3257 TaxID=1381097 RepID=A0ABQ0J1R5_GLUTH|nr:hypothetical protein NBRC3255_2277 [Gluconobacter thailandicus NBRC 3255]GAD27768.1 hypothetical protein NBRC3257_2767 [Gluconobacter thailandicus NBRC 3257]